MCKWLVKSWITVLHPSQPAPPSAFPLSAKATSSFQQFRPVPLGSGGTPLSSHPTCNPTINENIASSRHSHHQHQHCRPGLGCHPPGWFSRLARIPCLCHVSLNKTLSWILSFSEKKPKSSQRPRSHNAPAQESPLTYSAPYSLCCRCPGLCSPSQAPGTSHLRVLTYALLLPRSFFFKYPNGIFLHPFTSQFHFFGG